MRIFRHFRDVPETLKGAVVAIGNFDGVHKGHQALIAEARAEAEDRRSALRRCWPLNRIRRNFSAPGRTPSV